MKRATDMPETTDRPEATGGGLPTDMPETTDMPEATGGGLPSDPGARRGEEDEPW